jgi:nitrogen fixation-related uncharacterized protein
MQAVEIAIFIGVAVIIGSLLITFLIGWNVNDSYDDLKNIITPEKKIGYKQIDSENFVIIVSEIWKSCAYGLENKTVPIYVKKTKHGNEEYITKESFFKDVKKLNWCMSIQSKKYDCGGGEDVIMNQNHSLPYLFTISCKNNSLIIE